MAPKKRERDDVGGSVECSLWNSSSLTDWQRHAPPSGDKFLAALLLRRGSMRRPAPDLLFEGTEHGGDSHNELWFNIDDAVIRSARASSASGALSGTDPVRWHHVAGRLVEWKLQHGVFRPGLLQLVRSNTPAVVFGAIVLAAADLVDAARECPQAVGEDQNAPLLGAYVRVVRQMTEKLRGVGPATASLLISRCRFVDQPTLTNRFPFFGDDAAAAALATPARQLKYTLPELKAFVSKLWERYDALVMAGEWASSSSSIAFSVADMSHCLWAAAVHARLRNSSS